MCSAVPRVRTRTTSPAHACGLSEHRGYQRVSWDAVELPSQFLENYAWHPDVLRANLQSRRHPGSRCRLQPGAIDCNSQLPCGLQDDAAAGICAVDFRFARRVRPVHGARRDADAARSPKRGRRGGLSPTGTFPQQFRAHLRRATPPATTVTNGPRYSRRDAFAAFEETACSTARPLIVSSTRILTRGGSRDALEAFIDFRGRRPDVRAL